MASFIHGGLWQGIVLTLVLAMFASAPVSGQEQEKKKEKKPKKENMRSALIGQKFIPEDVDMDNPIYQTSFDDPSVLKDWKLEGGKSMSVVNGSLVLESDPNKTEIDGDAEKKDKPSKAKDDNTMDAPRSKDHLVCWMTKEVPADFLLEFTVRPSNRQLGLNIVFFGAKGLNGENIFEPPIQPRTGLYPQYNRGDINAYHISYWAANRESANFRKSKGFNLVAEGDDLITNAPADAFQTIRVYKRGGDIRMMVDDVVALAWKDDGEAFGPVLGSGWTALRQMGHTHSSEYGDYKVYPLKP